MPTETLKNGVSELTGRPVGDAPDLMLGLDVDAKEKEKKRLEAAKRAKGAADKAIPAASFTDQIRAAKTARDPLLDKLVSPQADRPIPPKR